MTDVWTVHSDTNSMAQPSLKSHLKATVANIVLTTYLNSAVMSLPQQY